MKTTDKQTSYILIKAETNSDWDSCDFAIITISNKWIRRQKERLKFLESIKDDSFSIISYRDFFIDFYRTHQQKLNEEPTPNIKKILGDKNWSFVELEPKDLEEFKKTENRLNCCKINLDRDGDIYYTAFGKHTGEDFWTEIIKLTDIIK